MEQITINKLIKKVREYDKEATEEIKKAYQCAEYLHRNQLRQSGEPYIIHPLNVAYILSEMQADKDTICAALLHDTLEDTNITYKEIESNFNSEIAKLVDGVTKISKMNFSTKEEQNYANTRKIITGITQDVRIIIIKLADRLHNMRTIQYKTEFKQKENSLETLKVFVPLANYIGAYRMKTELEDISFKCLDSYQYQSIEEKAKKIQEDSKKCRKEILFKLKKILNDKNCPYEIKIRMKNIYGIYKSLQSGHSISNIHDLIAFKIMVEEIDECYLLLRPIHENYKPVNGCFKDYISNPKTNLYQSLHTTVFSPDGRLIQMQIRPKDIDKIASFGLARYWNQNGNNARIIMQNDLKNKFQFFNSIKEINKVFVSNEEFIKHAEKELFADQVYVFTPTGKIIELPLGSTIIDFVYKLNDNLANNMIGALVNEEIVPMNYQLKSGDIVKIITDEKAKGPQPNWEKNAITTLAKRKIREHIYSDYKKN